MSARTPLHSWIAIVAIACSDSPAGPPAYEPLPLPPLEAVPFDQLGNGIIVFLRVAVGAPSYQAAYVIDASSQRAWPGPGSSGELVIGPSVAPDGRRIALLQWSGELSAAYDVYVADLDGDDERRVATFELNAEGPPSWTPDGSQIAFVVEEGTEPSIYRQSPVSSPADRVLVRRFTRAADGSAVCPFTSRSHGPISVSPQGLIAFNCMGGEIDVMQADGRFTAAYTAPAPPAGRMSVVHAPAWSPDGTRLAFIEESRETTGFETLGTSVIVVDPSLGTSTVLATVPTNGASSMTGMPHFSLCWLPGGSGIVFTAPEGPAATHIFVVAVQSGVVTRVTSAPSVFDQSVSCSR